MSSDFAPWWLERTVLAAMAEELEFRAMEADEEAARVLPRLRECFRECDGLLPCDLDTFLAEWCL